MHFPLAAARAPRGLLGFRPRLWLLPGSAFVFAAWCILFRDLLVDDAFIYLRFATHLHAGAGCTWNPGQPPVEGVTSLLWLAFLVPFAGAPATLVTAAKLLGVAAALATVTLFVRIAAWLEGAQAAVVTGSVLLLAPLLGFHAASGMETNLAALVVAALCACIVRSTRDASCQRGVTWWGLSIGALTWIGSLVRPEVVLFAAIAAALAWRSLPRGTRFAFAAYAAAGGGVPGAVTLAMRYVTFGHLMPLPYHVKSGLPGPMSMGYVALMLLGLLGGSMAVLGWGAGSHQRRSSASSTRGLVLPALACVLALLATRPMMGYVYRFAVPFWPPLVLGASVRLTRCWRQGDRRRALWSFGLLVAYHCTAALPAWHQVHIVTPAARAVHVAFGRTLAALPQSGRLVALDDVGAAAYYSGWETYEGAGLVTPPVSLGHAPTSWLIATYAPDVILLAQCRTERLGDGRGYVQVARLPWLVFAGGSRDYQCVYCREDFAGRAALTARLCTAGYPERPAPWYFAVYQRVRALFRLDSPGPPDQSPSHQNG